MQSQRLVHKHVGRAFFIGGYSYQKRCTLRAKHIGNICCCAVRHYVRSTDKVRPLHLLPVRAKECPCALGIPCSNRNVPIPIKVAVSVDEQNHTAVDARKRRAGQRVKTLRARSAACQHNHVSRQIPIRYHPCGNLVRRVASIIAIQPLHAARSEHALHRLRRHGARTTRNENRARQLLDALHGFPRQFPALGLSLLKENRNAVTVCKAADRQSILEVR